MIELKKSGIKLICFYYVHPLVHIRIRILFTTVCAPVYCLLRAVQTI